MPAGVRQQVQRLAGVHTAAGEEIAPPTAVPSVVKPMPVWDSRICPCQAISAGSFAFQLEGNFIDLLQQPFSGARQCSDVAIRIVATLVPDRPHNAGRVLD
jgi:hypothetical protein